MDDHVAVAGAQDRDVVDAAGGMRQQVRHLDARAAVSLERPLRTEELGVRLYELVLGFAELRRSRLSVQLVQAGASGRTSRYGSGLLP